MKLLPICLIVMVLPLAAAEYSREIAEVKAGIRREAKASWWGFDQANATACLQAAIDSGVPKLVIDQTGNDWIIDPISLTRDNQEIIIAESVVLRARSGGYLGTKDAMFSIIGRKNISICGENGAALVMNKKDYQDKARYKPAEWRHTINLLSAENIRISNLRLASSGGDGIYVGSTSRAPTNYCKDILIENVVSEDHHRQGISVISVENLTIRKSIFRNTKGAPPQSGIDFEPNNPQQRLVNCLLEDSVFSGNAGMGIEFHLKNLKSESTPVSITCRNCVVENNKVGTSLFMIRQTNNPLQGSIRYENCRFIGSLQKDIGLIDCGPGFSVALINCSVENQPVSRPALSIDSYGTSSMPLGNVQCENLQLPACGGNPLQISQIVGVALENTITGSILSDGKNFDLKEFMASQLAFNNKLMQMTLLTPNPADLIPPAPAAPLTDKPPVLNFRHQPVMLLYAKAGEEIKADLIADPIRRGRPFKFSAELISPTGKKLRKIDFSPDHLIEKLVFTAEENGLYRIETNTKKHLLNFQSSHSGQALTSAKALQFVNPRGKLYFEVPAGATEFSLPVWGDPGETIKAVSLVNPQGKKVHTLRNFSHMQLLEGKRPADAPAEIWAVEFGGSVEDVALMLPAPLLPLTAPDPNLLLRRK